MEDQTPDLTLDEKKYVRVPVKFLWAMFALWAAAVYSYSNVITQIADNRRTTDSMALEVKSDHKMLMDMHDDVLKISDFVDESKRMYNRYFRDFNDPDRKN